MSANRMKALRLEKPRSLSAVPMEPPGEVQCKSCWRTVRLVRSGGRLTCPYCKADNRASDGAV